MFSRSASTGVRLVTLTGVVGVLCSCTASGGSDTAEPTPAASVMTTATTAPSPTPEAPAPSPTPPPPPPAVPVDPTATVQVVVVSAGWEAGTASVEASAMVPVLEEGGTCTLALTQGPATASTSGPAAVAATTTSCPLLAVPRDQLGPGVWDAVITYVSPATTASSTVFQVEVPA